MSTSRGGLLAIQCKRGEGVELSKHLGDYARATYSDRGEDVLSNALEDLQEIAALRNEIVTVTNSIEKQQENLSKYYSILSAMEMRFPISKDKSHVSSLQFTWWDAFKPTKKEKQQNINFEKAAVLFNLAALHSQQAVGEERTNSDSLKAACRKFQEAAGYYAYLKDNVSLRTDAPHPLDVSFESAKMLEILMLAQAQECVYEKAVNENKSKGVCARLGKQCAIFYHEVVSVVQKGPLSSHLDKAWVAHLGCKEAYFSGESEYMMAEGEREKDETNVGPQIARLRFADIKLKECIKAAKSANNKFLTEASNKLSQTIAARLSKAVKENETVYLTRVPAYETLSPVNEAAMVKPTDPANVHKVNADVFVGLVPDSSAKTVSKYTEMVDVLIKGEKDKLCGSTDEARLKLKELELPDMLLALDAGNAQALKMALSDGLYQRVDELNSRSGVTHCFELAKELQGLRNVGISMLNTAEQELEAESKGDEAQRAHFGEKWTIPLSASLTMLLRDHITEFRAKLTSAEENDKRILDQLNNPESPVQLLNPSKLRRSLPVLQPQMVTVGPDAGAAVPTLKAVLMRLEECAAERTSLEERLNEMKFKDNIIPKLMSSRDTEESIFTQEMSKYKPLQDMVTANVRTQNELLGELTQRHADFITAYNVSEWRAACATYAMQVKMGYDTYSQIQHDLEEGLRFYSTLQDAVKGLKQQCSDFALTRQMQRDDFIRQLKQQEAAQQAAHAHHTYAHAQAPPQVPMGAPPQPPQYNQQPQYSAPPQTGMQASGYPPYQQHTQAPQNVAYPPIHGQPGAYPTQQPQQGGYPPAPGQQQPQQPRGGYGAYAAAGGMPAGYLPQHPPPPPLHHQMQNMNVASAPQGSPHGYPASGYPPPPPG